MTNKLETLQNTLIININSVFKNGKKTQKQEITDVALLNMSILPYINLKKLENNMKWEFSEIQHEIYNLINYDFKNKDTKNFPFEMRVLRATEQTILVMEKVNPNEYKGSNTHDEKLKDKNYKTSFKSKMGYRFDNKGQLQLPSISLLPITIQEVEGKNGKMKKEKFINADTSETSLRSVSQSIATNHFMRAFPQTKKGRNSNGKQEKTAYKTMEAVTKFIDSKTAVYKDFIDSKGTRSNAEAVSETNAKIIAGLQKSIVEFMKNRDEAEMFAEELEETINTKIEKVA